MDSHKTQQKPLNTIWKASELGHVDAAFNVGVMYDEGKVLAQKQRESL